MELGDRPGQMEGNMKDSLLLITKKAMEFTIGLMVESLKDGGI
jgi:hypothetical protein